jgi:hypothetical protein
MPHNRFPRRSLSAAFFAEEPLAVWLIGGNVSAGKEAFIKRTMPASRAEESCGETVADGRTLSVEDSQ